MKSLSTGNVTAAGLCGAGAAAVRRSAMKIYFIDTFTSELFYGSPAAVAVLDKWYPDGCLLKLARENAVPESAFLVEKEGGYEIRWFTHRKEIGLCGHAALAAAYAVAHFLEPGCRNISFDSAAGRISVLCKPGDFYELTLNAFELKRTDITDELLAVVKKAPIEAYLGRDYLLVYENEECIRGISPGWDETMDFKGKLISVTARGDRFDCVSRTFVPHNRMAEEEACGSAHCHIAPYWAERLAKKEIKALQASNRGGVIYCRCEAGKVMMSGGCVLYMAGEIPGLD